MDPGADETDSVILRAKLLYFNAIVNLQCQERCLFAPSLTGFSFNPHCKINYDNRLDRSYPRILSQFVFQGLGFQASHLDILALPVCSSCYNFSLQVVHNGPHESQHLENQVFYRGSFEVVSRWFRTSKQPRNMVNFN